MLFVLNKPMITEIKEELPHFALDAPGGERRGGGCVYEELYGTRRVAPQCRPIMVNQCQQIRSPAPLSFCVYRKTTRK